MKKLFLGLCTIACACSLFAASINDFEDTTTALHSSWAPGYSGSTAGINKDIDAAAYDETQGAASSAKCVKLTFDWTGATGVVRLQPLGNIPQAGADQTAEPFLRFYVKADVAGDTIQPYVTDSGGAYEIFDDAATISTEWDQHAWDAANDSVSSYLLTADESIAIDSVRLRGFKITQGSAAGSQNVYLDELDWNATPVTDWTVY